MDVVGISMDSVRDLARFHEAQELGFALLSDPDGSAATKYGVLRAQRPFAARVSFVIDAEGTLRLVDEEVRVDSHGADLVEQIRKLRQAR